MAFLDSLRKVFGGLSGPGPGPGQEAASYWLYVRCRRCGEPLKTRIDLRNDLSLADDGETYLVRKGLVGSGARRCFQTIEVTLTFDHDRRAVQEREIGGGEFITEDEYRRLLAEQPIETTEERPETSERDERPA